MKTVTLFCMLLSVSVTGLSQHVKPNQEQIQVQVSIKETDSLILVNAIDLIGSWKNISSTSPIVGSNVPKSLIEISNGNIVIVNDAWKEDYPNKLKSCTWRIVDHELQFNSPDLGVVKIDIEKLKGSNYFEFTFNSFTYRKLVNPSR